MQSWPERKPMTKANDNRNNSMNRPKSWFTETSKAQIPEPTRRGSMYSHSIIFALSWHFFLNIKKLNKKHLGIIIFIMFYYFSFILWIFEFLLEFFFVFFFSVCVCGYEQKQKFTKANNVAESNMHWTLDNLQSETSTYENEKLT